MIFLVELDALNGADQPETLRFSDAGLMTLPTDTPANVFYAPRVGDPGNIERHLFSDGRTFGDVSVGAGDVLLKNIDGALDDLRDYAFDGRAIRIYTLTGKAAPFGSRRLQLEGTVAQTEFQDGDFAITVRDWLEALRQPLQGDVYTGATTSGGSPVAEGGEDLKDKTKTMLWGRKRNIPAVVVDFFGKIYEANGGPVAAISAVYDRGVPLAGSGDYGSLAALKAAALQPGQFATCLAIGKFRLGGEPVGLITCDAVEVGSASDRTAGQIARRMLLKAGMIEGEDFLAADIAALDTSVSYECGIWYGADANVTTLQALSFVLQSVGASIAPDFSGVYRVRRFLAPDRAKAVKTIDEAYIIGPGEDLDRDAPGDESDGLPTKKVTVRWGINYAVASASDLDTTNSSAEFRAFATQEWRQATATANDTAERHLLAHEMTFDTALVSLANAEAEAGRRLALYRVSREVFRVTLPTQYAAGVDLSDTVILRASRYGLEQGRAVVVIGVQDEFEVGHTTLTLWG